MATSIEALVDRQIRRGQFAEQAGRERQSTAAPPRPVHRVITISRQAGAGGRRLADRIAAHLNFEVIDRQIIDMLVQSTGARERLIRSLDHDVVSGIDLWVQGVITGRYVDRDEYAQWLVKIITALAEHGQAVIIGRAASAILRQRGGLHIRLVAPLEDRVRNLILWEKLSIDRARERVHRLDEERRRFYRDYFNADWDDPEGYHLVINTSRIRARLAEEMILTLWHRMIATEVSAPDTEHALTA